jgi:hypothetical protein
MRAKELAFLRALPSASNFDKVRVTQKNESNAMQKSSLLRTLPSESNFYEV